MNKIYLLGDSTCQTNNEDTYPQTGWGQLLNLFVNENYEVVNLAKNGRSTKSFIDEGLFEICKNNLKENDIVIIQFGHNDEKDDVLRHTIQHIKKIYHILLIQHAKMVQYQF